jgi:outer membrane protein assembly factor BamB
MRIYEEKFRYVSFQDGYYKDNFDGTYTVYSVSKKTGFDKVPFKVDEEPNFLSGKPQISEGSMYVYIDEKKDVVKFVSKEDYEEWRKITK